MRFDGDPREPSWDRAFEEACGSISRALGAHVVDRSDAVPPGGGSRIGTLFVRVIRPSDVGSPELLTAIATDIDNQSRIEGAALCYCPCGEHSADTVPSLRADVESFSPKQPYWVVEAIGAESLKEQLTDVLMTVVLRGARSGMESAGWASSTEESEVLLERELPDNPSDIDSSRTFRPQP